MVTKEIVVKALRDARDIMNHSGAHWAKGDEIVVYEDDNIVRFCSMGGLKEALGVPRSESYFKPVPRKVEPVLMVAMIELADTIDKARMDEAREDYEDDDEWKDEWLYDTAADVITSYNDNYNTKWEDIKTAFTKTAARVARRKS